MKRSVLTEQTAVVLGILALLGLFFHQIIFQGRTFKVTTANPQALISGPYGQEKNQPAFFTNHATDVSLNEEPTLAFIRDSLHRGILPLWNPHLGCGYPLIGLIQTGMFYPLNFLYYALPDKYGWDALMLARMFFAGLFMYGLMRFLTYPVMPSLAAMVLFMLGRPMVTVQAWMVNVDILLPLLFLCLEKMLREPAWRNSALTAGAIGLSVLAGHPEHLVLMHVLGVSFYIFRWSTDRRGLSFPAAAGRLAVSYALGLSLAAPALLPFIYNFLTVFWNAHPSNMGAVQDAAGTPWYHTSFLFPNFFQKYPVARDFTYWAWWGSVGVLPTGLAVLGLWERHNRKLKWFFFAAALLAVLGLELLTYVPRYDVKRFNSFPDTPYIDFIKNSSPRGRAYGLYWTFYPDAASGYQVDDLGINHGLLCKRFTGFVNNFLIPGHFKKDFHSISLYVAPITFVAELRPYLDLLNVQYTIVSNPFPRDKRIILPDPKKVHPVYSDEVNIYVHTGAIGRAFVVHRAAFVPNLAQVVGWMKRFKQELRLAAVVQGKPDPEVIKRLDRAPVGDGSVAVIRKYSPNEVVLEADMKHDGLVVLSDTYHPDWQATVDGQAATIYPTDYLIRSVFVPAGRHTVRFVFRPWSFRLGLVLSGLALIAGLGLLAAGRPPENQG
jgi:hypothetical protein